MKKRVLVTGGAGYIGSHTVVELQQGGYEVEIVDNLSNSSEHVIGQIERITGQRPRFTNLDLCDAAALGRFVDASDKFDGVIHFAAFKAVGESVEQPLKYYHNNFYSLINILKAFEEQPVNLVFSSSCTVYGQPDELPVTESAAVKTAESPYGNTKQIAEEILKEVATASRNYKVVSLRYFNPTGAHSSGLIGELPVGVPQNLVPFITQSAIGKRGPITVYGNDYNTPDGSCIRDYIHVVDLAKAHLAALNYLEDEKSASNYEVFNVGTGKGASVLEVISAFERSTQVKLNYRVGERRPGDIEQVWGDTTKSERVLGWKAELSIDDMMRSAWAWENSLASAANQEL